LFLGFGQKVVLVSFFMEPTTNLLTYKAFDCTEVVGLDFVGAILGSDDAPTVLTLIPDPPELANIVAAVLDLATQGDDFIPLLADIRDRIPVSIHKSLSPTFFFPAFPEIRLDAIQHSPLFDLIYDILNTSDNTLLLAECASFILACVCANSDCIRSLVKLGFLDLLFWSIPRVFPLRYPPIIVNILNSLTVIWKRLSSISLPTTISADQFSAVLYIINPLFPVYVVPFVRFICCLLVCGSLDAEQTDKLIFHLHNIMYKFFTCIPDPAALKSGSDLGQLAEIAIAMSRSESLQNRLIVSRSHPFFHISRSIDLLPPPVATRFLFFYDECDRFCDKKIMHELLAELSCECLVGFLDVGSQALTEAALNVISLMIERNCIEPEIICDHIIPSIIEKLVESMVADRFRLKHAALRFVHAVVVHLDWSALPDETFVQFLHIAPDCVYLSDEDPTESVWFLESLLAALMTDIPEFFDLVVGICNELDIWSTVDELRGKGPVFEALIVDIDSIQHPPEPEKTDAFLA
jgi:hypothetical protein